MRAPVSRSAAFSLSLVLGGLSVGLAGGLVAPASADAAQSCQGPLTRPESDFSFLGDGSQVLDKKNNLIWMRCLEGQRWTGATCAAEDPKAVNPGPSMTWAQAQSYATSRRTKDEAWRMPSKPELLTIREAGCYNPSLNLRIFPTEPAWSSDGDFWTSTRQAEGVALVSAIGASDSWSKTTTDRTSHVRLVRDVPKDTPKGSAKQD